MTSKKSLGQHFLRTRLVANKITDTIRPERGEIIFEIGPGHGELTRPLAEICRARGCALIAIEKDRQLALKLQAQSWTKEIEIITGDVLTVFASGRASEIFRGKPYKIVGNIPYYLTGHLLRIIGELTPRPARCILMLQKEVAERLAAKPPMMNRLAASVQFWAKPEILGIVPKENFAPAPKVDSAILSLDAKDAKRKQNVSDGATEAATEGAAEATAEAIAETAAEASRYYAVVRTLFAQPRKTVLNNLAAKNPLVQKGEIASALRAIGIMPDLRPQDLSVEKIAAIAEITEIAFS
ncbi:MAG: 16S rRNA (adenine(1518)-N(6)/adenine(1519)-N(6))-dimethyltransferase RsmA [Minisyncoccia bacterium]|jgi:16S rRNA (adenine1518-N6/adenine1519-N6)-dimethyltransferase